MAFRSIGCILLLIYIYIYIYKDLLDACIAFRLLLKKKIEEKNSIWTKISYYYYYRAISSEQSQTNFYILFPISHHS